jgi:hypothetical protein
VGTLKKSTTYRSGEAIMYEFMQTENGWLLYWGPPPVQAKKKGPWQQLKESLGRPAAGETCQRVRFVQQERTYPAAAELMASRT